MKPFIPTPLFDKQHSNVTDRNARKASPSLLTPIGPRVVPVKQTTRQSSRREKANEDKFGAGLESGVSILVGAFEDRQTAADTK